MRVFDANRKAQGMRRKQQLLRVADEAVLLRLRRRRGRFADAVGGVIVQNEHVAALVVALVVKQERDARRHGRQQERCHDERQDPGAPEGAEHRLYVRACRHACQPQALGFGASGLGSRT